MFLVVMILVSLAHSIHVRGDLGVVALPLWCDVPDGVIEVWLLVFVVQVVWKVLATFTHLVISMSSVELRSL